MGSGYNIYNLYFFDTESENESCVGDVAGRGDESWRELCSTLVGYYLYQNKQYKKGV